MASRILRDFLQLFLTCDVNFLYQTFEFELFNFDLSCSSFEPKSSMLCVLVGLSAVLVVQAILLNDDVIKSRIRKGYQLVAAKARSGILKKCCKRLQGSDDGQC